ncbi:MAG: ATP-binding protein [Deltaproteobacteria bacterium]|nr:ATP-binding protein [Deltaproteobacteria bacterium]
MLPIRIRLTFWYVGIFSITLILYSMFLFTFVSHKIMNNTDRELLAEAKESRDIFLEEMTKPSFEELDEELRGINYYLQIYSMDGRSLYSSANLYNAELPVDTVSFKGIREGRHTFRDVTLFRHTEVRALFYPIGSGGTTRYYMVIAMPLSEQQAFLHMLSIILTLVTPIVIIVASWGGIVIAGRAMKPVDEIIETAKRIEAGNLAEQIKIKTHNDEIGKLAGTFNDMLMRLQKAFDSLANFSQNVSHELKTPLTVMKSGIEITMREKKSAAEYRELLVSLLEEVDQMTRTIDDLLLTSLSDTASIRASFASVDLSGLILQTIDFLGILVTDKDVVLEHHVHGGIIVPGNERLLKRALSNIIDNAIKFTPSGKRVSVSLAKGDKGAVIVISDQGIGIPEEEIPKIFDRFYRGKSANSEGHGLGLNIVKWIIELHGGTISAVSTSGGTSFTIGLPSSSTLPPPSPGKLSC